MSARSSLSQILVLLLNLVPQILCIVDCTHGFVGRMQQSLTDSFTHINDTRMCAAEWCIKVVIHSAIDDDNTFQQGVSSRCGYTGGDRQMCTLSSAKCTPINFYDGMRGNFSFCCCREISCNVATPHEIDALYGKPRKRVRSNVSTHRSASLLWLTSIFGLVSAFL